MTDDLISVSDVLEPELVPMPADAADVCPMCRSGRTSSELCRSCTVTSGQVAYPCQMVIPISFYETPSRLRDRMHDFKEHADAAVRVAECRAVASILGRYVHEHGDALADRFGEWDASVAVPSTHHDDAPVLQTAVESNFSGVLAPFERPLGRGSEEMKFLQASETGFAVHGDVAGRSLLLVDDTFTTGARLQSAHHALVEAGAVIPAAIVVTRKINPSEEYGSLDMWQRQKTVDFDFASVPWWKT